jgi:hypothetical protein
MLLFGSYSNWVFIFMFGITGDMLAIEFYYVKNRHHKTYENEVTVN